MWKIEELILLPKQFITNNAITVKKDKALSASIFKARHTVSLCVKCSDPSGFSVSVELDIGILILILLEIEVALKPEDCDVSDAVDALAVDDIESAGKEMSLRAREIYSLTRRLG